MPDLWLLCGGESGLLLSGEERATSVEAWAPSRPGGRSGGCSWVPSDQRWSLKQLCECAVSGGTFKAGPRSIRCPQHHHLPLLLWAKAIWATACLTRGSQSRRLPRQSLGLSWCISQAVLLHAQPGKCSAMLSCRITPTHSWVYPHTAPSPSHSQAANEEKIIPEPGVPGQCGPAARQRANSAPAKLPKHLVPPDI